jgi:hypothetical protein
MGRGYVSQPISANQTYEIERQGLLAREEEQPAYVQCPAHLVFHATTSFADIPPQLITGLNWSSDALARSWPGSKSIKAPAELPGRRASWPTGETPGKENRQIHLVLPGKKSRLIGLPDALILAKHWPWPGHIRLF